MVCRIAAWILMFCRYPVCVGAAYHEENLPGGSGCVTAAPAFSFSPLVIALMGRRESPPERLLTAEILLYIFVCKTHKNGKNMKKIG